jgi:DNA-binding NarL/FixJ family response regulator
MANTGVIKLMLVDDHTLVRNGIMAMLQNLPDMKVISEAGDGTTAIIKVDEEKPDIILMDIMMPNMSGFETAKIIREKYPDVKVVFLSMEVNEQFISEAIAAEASGYIPKDSNRDELLQAIRKVFAGEQYFSSSVSQLVFANFMKKASGKMPEKAQAGKISKREIEVIKLIASGVSNKEIADKLFISTRTVDAHRNHILQKLELKSTADLIKYAIKNKLITLE